MELVQFPPVSTVSSATPTRGGPMAKATSPMAMDFMYGAAEG
jgi:hypothetical protein